MLKADWFRVALGMFSIGFGANLFAPLLPSYRVIDDLSQSQVTWLLGVYVLGLVPALIIGGPLSDVRGRRAIVRPALVTIFIGSIVLAAGMTGSFIILSVGRFIVGAAVGLMMAAGAAWLKELSPGSDSQGARRATAALSAGFGSGPLVSGAIAQWFPHPDLLPYIVHIALMMVVIPLVWNLPSPQVQTNPSRTYFPRTALSPRFLLAVAAWAPWVFGTATTSFAALTSLVVGEVSIPVAYTGFIASITMLTGALIQPLATRFGTDLIPPAVIGLLFTATGMALGVIVTITLNPLWVIPAAFMLGAAYGTMMVSGLREVQMIAPRSELGALTAIYYALTYVGFFAPFVLSFLGPRFGYTQCLIAGIFVALLSIVPVARAAATAAKGGRATAS